MILSSKYYVTTRDYPCSTPEIFLNFGFRGGGGTLGKDNTFVYFAKKF